MRFEGSKSSNENLFDFNAKNGGVAWTLVGLCVFSTENWHPCFELLRIWRKIIYFALVFLVIFRTDSDSQVQGKWRQSTNFLLAQRLIWGNTRYLLNFIVFFSILICYSLVFYCVQLSLSSIFFWEMNHSWVNLVACVVLYGLNQVPPSAQFFGFKSNQTICCLMATISFQGTPVLFGLQVCIFKFPWCCFSQNCKMHNSKIGFVLPSFEKSLFSSCLLWLNIFPDLMYPEKLNEQCVSAASQRGRQYRFRLQWIVYTCLKGQLTFWGSLSPQTSDRNLIYASCFYILFAAIEQKKWMTLLKQMRQLHWIYIVCILINSFFEPFRN